MIVNAARTVDKYDFFHKLNGLRAPEAVEQTLVLDGIETGQKIGDDAGRRFNTFDPVDIQQLIHKAGWNRSFSYRQGWFFMSRQPARSTSSRGRTDNSSGVRLFFEAQETGMVEVACGVVGAARPKSKIFFFRQGQRLCRASPGLLPKACIQNDGNS